jgi:hypothetical protein
LLIEVEDEVDRVVFRIQNLGEGDTILVAYPEFMLAAAAGIREEGVIAGDPPRLLPQPNPVRVGAPLRVLSSGGVRLYDVLGRELLSVSPAPGTERLFIDTSRLGAGVFLISPLDGVAPAKVVVLR